MNNFFFRYDSNAPTTESEDEGGSDTSGKEKKEKKHKKAKTVSEKPRKKKKEKKQKNSNAPKRPPSAYFIWMSENREKLKEENPSLSITELAKKAGEVWRELKNKTVSFYLLRVTLADLCKRDNKNPLEKCHDALLCINSLKKRKHWLRNFASMVRKRHDDTTFCKIS